MIHRLPTNCRRKLFHLWARLDTDTTINEGTLLNRAELCESVVFLHRRSILSNSSESHRIVRKCSFLTQSVFWLCTWIIHRLPTNSGRQKLFHLWTRLHTNATINNCFGSQKLHFRTILCDSEELLHLWFRLCPASLTNEIFFADNSSAVCESFMSTDYLGCVKQLHFRTILCDSEELFQLWLRLCVASPTNEIFFVGNSSADCESFMSIVRILWLCRKTTLSHNSARFRWVFSFMVASVCSLAHKWNIFIGNSSAIWGSFMSTLRLLWLCKKLHFRTILCDSEELFHLWLRLCVASPTNKIITAGNSSAVCGSFMSTVRLLRLCKTTTLSHNSARFRGITSFMFSSVTSLTHKWNNYFICVRYFICGCNNACVKI